MESESMVTSHINQHGLLRKCDIKDVYKDIDRLRLEVAEMDNRVSHPATVDCRIGDLEGRMERLEKLIKDLSQSLC